MVGAGQVMRIFNQLEGFPIDIIGNYGLQYAKYNPDTKDLDIIRDLSFDCDKDIIEEIFTEGANKARMIARKKLFKVQSKIGLM